MGKFSKAAPRKEVLTAISTFRPFEDRHSEHSKNQIAAWQSWQHAFDAILYLNQPEPALVSNKTRFIPWEDFPSLKDAARLAIAAGGWACIINADIVVSDRMPEVENYLRNHGAQCASSWRYEFDPVIGRISGKVVDNGLDFFAAESWMWERVADVASDTLRLGCTFWDTWLLSFFNAMAPGTFYDLTPARLIFHPKHGDRKYGPGPDHKTIPVFGRPMMGRKRVVLTR